MATWEFYIDESYNSHLFCVGGFLPPVGMWREIVDPWRARIDYENRKSAIKPQFDGLPVHHSFTNRFCVLRKVRTNYEFP